jgi:hypothetical protein
MIIVTDNIKSAMFRLPEILTIPSFTVALNILFFLLLQDQHNLGNRHPGRFLLPSFDIADRLQ